MSDTAQEIHVHTTQVMSRVPRHLLGQALMQLDRVPLNTLRSNQEYAAPGTAKWMAETIQLLQRLVDLGLPVEGEWITTEWDYAGRPKTREWRSA